MTIRCSGDHGHANLNTKKKRCHDSLEKLCTSCDAFVNYSNAAKHLKRCQQAAHEDGADNEDEEDEQEEKVVRVTYLAAAWKDDGLPLSQYLGALSPQFPAHLRRTLVDDDSCVDAYDAIWGSLFATNTRFRLVHTYRTLDDVMSAVYKDDLPRELDLLVLGNWMHKLAARDEVAGKGITERFLKALQTLEVDRQIRVFPPLDYVWPLAQKAHYYTRLQRCPLPKQVYAIPTIAVPEGHMWKKRVREFAQQRDAERVIFKRELSELSKHALKMDVASIAVLPGRGEESGFRWMVQPLLSEFEAHPELRMYVIDGRCRWGVATRLVNNPNRDGDDDDDGPLLSMEAVAPGRRTWTDLGGREAAALAEQVVASVKLDHPHGAHFLRVDMVRRRDGGWWINELEIFGSAFIFFSAFDNASEMLEDVVNGTKKWVLDLIAPH